MKILILQLFLLFWSGQTFRIATETECIPPEVDTKSPQCELHVEATKGSVQVSCPRNQVIRIVGDFHALRINCTATFPIEFNFDGITPTEAIRVRSWRTLKERQTKLEIESFHFEVKVLSISALYEHFKGLNNPIELRDDFKYSRTGEYQFKGFRRNANYINSFYIFLEEPLAKHDFIRNNRTVWKRERSGILLPCRPTHYQSNVILDVPSEAETYDVRKGFTVKSNTLRAYTCKSWLDGNVAQITFDTSHDIQEIPFGFLKPLGTQGVTISFLHDLDTVLQKQQSNRLKVYSSCGVTQQGQRPSILYMIGARSYVELELASDFVLPAFANRSYAVDVGQEALDLNQQLRTRGTSKRVGVAFCANERSYDTKMYGAGFTGNPYSFPFHNDMFSIRRETSKIDLYMKIDRKKSNQSIYEGDEVELTCQVLTVILVPPVVWFVRYTDGSNRTVHVDYNLDDETSSFKLKATLYMSQVICFASFWHKDFWRNISHNVTVSRPGKPTIVDGEYPEYIKTSKDSPLVLACRARGTPLPSILWESHETSGTIPILNSSSTSTKNGEVTSFLTVANPMETTYICVAKTGNDEAVKHFHVQFSSSLRIWVVVLICLAVALAAALPVFIYFRFFRKHEPLGLNRYEIAEFVNGEARDSQRASTNQYAHEFAHLCPYDKSYEIDATRFQIDNTSFLGKGAFGVVLKGLVDGHPVAVKTVSKNAEKAHLKSILSELKVHIHLGDHPHVVQFIGANTKDLSKGSVHMFVELCKLGNLESYLRSNKDALTLKKPVREGLSGVILVLFHPKSNVNLINSKPSLPRRTIATQDLINWSLQIASGMDYLSSKKVIHGDLAARNVLLDDNRVAKITDFGLSRQFQAYADYVKKQLEPLPWRWMALESLQRLTFSSKSDVWAYAVTLWEIFTLGEVPYVGMSWNLNFVNELEEGLRLPKPKHATDELYKNVMLACWENRPELRPTFSDIMDRIMQVFGIEHESSQVPPKAHKLSFGLNNHEQSV